MKTLYLDCGMGAAGDMLTAALLELLPDQEAFIKELNALQIPGVKIDRENASKCGITGTHMIVSIHGEEESEDMHHHHEHFHEHHHHSSMHDIEHFIEHLNLSDKVKNDILAVYKLIAEAESHVHGVPVTEIHFHEVGTMDALADITAVCLLMDRIAPEQVIVSPIHVGSGQVHCAHGILPVPAPATAFILRDIPIYSRDIMGELCTPTGAALLRYFADQFSSMPIMTVSSIGYGMGKKDFPAANCVRALLGETQSQTSFITELSCNVDDMTPEAIGFAMERLFEAGAVEVYTVPIGMKKSRPGTLLCVMCKEVERKQMISLMLKHTTTLGVRENTSRRHTLERKIITTETPFGPVRQKQSQGYGVTKTKYEFEDLARIAKEKHLSLAEVLEQINTHK